MLRLIGRAVGHSFLDYFLKPYWSDMWLKESLAVLLEAYIVDQVYPTARMTDLLIVQTQHESLRLDTDLIMNLLASETNNSSDLVLFFLRYMKVPFILRMTQQVLHENIFFDNFTNKYENNSTLEDYWYHMQHVVETIIFNYINKTKCSSIILPLKYLINTWITQPPPVLNVTRTYEGAVSIQADYSQSEQNIYIENKLLIPVTFVTQNYFYLAHVCNGVTWLTPFQNMVFIFGIPASDWIIVNSQQAGYYRVNYDLLNWLHIINYMNSENYDKIHVLNRAQLIDDSFNFMITQKFPPDLFWRLTKYLWRETDYIAWYPMFKALEYMSSILAFKSDQKLSNFTHMMTKTFDLLLEINYLEYRERDINDESTLIKSLRLEAIRWACIFESPACFSNATHHLKILLEHIANSTPLEKKKYSAEWTVWTFCNGLVKADRETWNNVLVISQDELPYVKRLLQIALPCSNISDIILNYLQAAINNADIEIILSIIVKQANKDVVLVEILSKFERIQLSKINRLALLCVIINNLYTNRQFDKIKDFAKLHLTQNSTSIFVDEKFMMNSNVTKQALEDILMKINLRQLQLERTYQKYIQYFGF
nr:PREDICTED: aminopeptidase N-like [Linepithema humile]